MEKHDDEGEEVVGYRCPPKKHRWKPGQSGNPKGRPRKPKPPHSINDAEILRRIDAEVIEIGGVKMTRHEAEVRRVLHLAAKGNARARSFLERCWKREPKPQTGGVLQMPMEYFQGRDES